jgi:major vault protein
MGCPKSDDSLLRTCFLQLEGNKVSDVVRVETADHVALSLSLSYRVSFESRDGGPEKWFNVNDYVGLLCDHLGSLLRAAARGATIDRFHTDGTEILRRAVLGDKAEGRRAGRMFEENDMWVYDVEVLDIRILDDSIEELIGDAQRAAIMAEMDHKKEQIRLAQERLRAEVDRQIDEARLQAAEQRAALERAERVVRVEQATTAVEATRVDKLGRARIEAEASTAIEQARLETVRASQALTLERRSAEVEAFRAQMEALHPELVATLKNLGHQQLAGTLTDNLGPLAILGGESVVDVAGKLLAALPVGGDGLDAATLIAELAPRPSNGAGSKPHGGKRPSGK